MQKTFATFACLWWPYHRSRRHRLNIETFDFVKYGPAPHIKPKHSNFWQICIYLSLPFKTIVFASFAQCGRNMNRRGLYCSLIQWRPIPQRVTDVVLGFRSSRKWIHSPPAPSPTTQVSWGPYCRERIALFMTMIRDGEKKHSSTQKSCTMR